MIATTDADGVRTIDLGPGENVLDRGRIRALRELFDEAGASAEVRAVVTTGTGRFYCNGLELPEGAGTPAPEDLGALEELLVAVLRTPVPTVAAIPGHAFAGGALLALAHDRRVARADRGFVCLPEVAIGVPLTPGMLVLLVDRVGPAVARTIALTGRRYGGIDAHALGLVDDAVPAAEVRPVAVERARELAAGDPSAFATMKAELQRDVVRALRPPPTPAGLKPARTGGPAAGRRP